MTKIGYNDVICESKSTLTISFPVASIILNKGLPTGGSLSVHNTKPVVTLPVNPGIEPSAPVRYN